MTRVGKILLIEDHPLVRASCRRVLTNAGALILEAKTGAEGLQLSRTEQPDIIFLDISLPDINGVDLLDRLRAEDVVSRIIVLTMYDDKALADRLLRRGAAGYLTKTDSPHSMLHAIERICGGRTFVSPLLSARAEHGIEDRLAGLSARDRRIIELLGEGKSLSEVSSEIGQSYKTIANVTNMIRRKLGLRINTALVKFAVEQRLTQSPKSDCLDQAQST